LIFFVELIIVDNYFLHATIISRTIILTLP